MVKTKIICTLGPSSSSAPVLTKMMRAGMDVVRLNFSHGSLQEHSDRIALVRHLNKKYRRHIRILGDLEGYRIRIASFKGQKSIEVKKNRKVILSTDRKQGGNDTIPFDYTGPLRRLKPGQQIFIDDGTIELVVESVTDSALGARVLIGGVIKEHKGVNMPGAVLSFEGITDRDRENLQFSLQHKFDFIAQSFVRSSQDIVCLRKIIGNKGHQPRVISKIENGEALENIDSIMDVSDGIMVARGDLGVSLPVWKVPLIQKALIRQCNKAGKFVITATQMLESMTEERIPTRAEVSDVANAVLDGSDYVMLSGETAVGIDPPACVDMMNKIISFTEKNPSP